MDRVYFQNYDYITNIVIIGMNFGEVNDLDMLEGRHACHEFPRYYHGLPSCELHGAGHRCPAPWLRRNFAQVHVKGHFG